MRELLPWEKTVVTRLGVTDPERAKKLMHDLRCNTIILEGRLHRIRPKE